MDWLINFFTRASDEIMISVVSGVVVLLVQVIVNYYRNSRTSARYKAYVGEYFLYCYHTNGDEKIIEVRLDIKRKFGRIIATIQTFNDSYVGSIRFSPENFYINLSAKNHVEHMQLIFFNTLFPVVNKLWGVGSCISVLGEPCALRFLLTRKRMSKSEMQQEFDSQQVIPSKHLLTVKKDISIYQFNSHDHLELANAAKEVDPSLECTIAITS